MSEEPKQRKPRGVARLIDGKCIACGARCQSSCRVDAIEMTETGEPVIDTSKCVGCRRCVKICPAEALEMYFTPEELKILESLGGRPEEIQEEEGEDAGLLGEYQGVWVIVEQTEGKAADVSWELLGKGSELAGVLGVDPAVVILGHQVEKLCQEAFAWGAGIAYLMDAPVFENYRTEPYSRACCYLIEKYKPEVVLFGATGLGRDLAGAVATRLETGLTADCTGLDIDEKGRLLQTRPAFGGNIMATILTERTRPQMATVRPHVMPLPERDVSRRGEVIRETSPVKEEEISSVVLEVIRDQAGADVVDVATAQVLVSGGRGMCGPENFSLLQELADELGGVVSCSRAVVEAGWQPPERQVGQTGKTVRPKIYIACGISGAIQHLVGMQESDVIIAINQDRQAPIFEVATYGIVGDVLKVVPAITRRIRRLRQEKAGVS